MHPGARLALKLFFAEFMVEKLIRSADIAIFFTEQLKYLIGSEFLTLFITGLLNDRSEFGVHGLRHRKSVFLHNIRGTALAGLTVYTDYRLVFPADICRVYREIRNLPLVGIILTHKRLTLVYGVLMRA